MPLPVKKLLLIVGQNVVPPFPLLMHLLLTLKSLEFPVAVPELICLVTDDSGETIGLIESAVAGMPLNFLSRDFDAESQLKTIAQVASAVHRLPKSKFTHLVQRSDSRTHVLEELNVLPGSLFDEFGEAAMVREWILRNLPEGRTSTVLHGDLLPQNLLLAIRADPEIAVVDWECAQIGDAAYDLAIVSRGVRRPFGIGVPTVNGQKTTLSQCGIGLSQRAKAFAMEFPFDVKAVFPIGVDVRVACRRQMHHIDVIDVIAFGSQLI